MRVPHPTLAEAFIGVLRNMESGRACPGEQRWLRPVRPAAAYHTVGRSVKSWRGGKLLQPSVPPYFSGMIFTGKP